MKSAVRSCPVSGEFSGGCPVQGFLRWCRKLLTGIIPTIPFREKNSDFERIIKHACSFCVLLISHQTEIQKETLERIPLQLKNAKPRDRGDALSKVFLNWNKESNGVFCSDFGVILAHTLLNHIADFHKSCDDDIGSYTRILSNYQMGIQVTYDIWRDVIVAYKVRYNRYPSPEELSQYHPFVIKFVHTIGQLPGLFAVPLRDDVTKAETSPNLFIDESGALGFIDDHVRKAKIRISDEVETLDADEIREVTTNRHCPALPMLTKIAQMCCEVFNKAYGEVYHQYK